MADANDNTADHCSNDTNDRLSHYEYYIFGTSIPVRFAVSKDEGRYGAALPGKEKGSLEKDATFLSKYYSDPDEFHPISENEFDQRVRDYTPPEPISDAAIANADKIYKEYLAITKSNS